MRLYQCDFCKKNKRCTQTSIDYRSYDICAECRTERDKQLSGRGEPQFFWLGYVPYMPVVAPQPVYVPMYPWTPTITGQVTWSTVDSNLSPVTPTVTGMNCLNA